VNTPVRPYQQQIFPVRRFSAAPQPEEGANYVIHRRRGMRCLAVIAHVDHGKTSLVDRLLQQSADTADASDRLMDSGELEKERGITITSKVTRIRYNDRNGEPVVINLADSPGHADFSAEVDRILSVTDGFLLLVDVVEGPKSQTKYVLSRALALGLHPVVVLNKCDRPEAAAKIDSGETESLIMDLFQSLGATDKQLEYTTMYASAREGWVTQDPLTALELAEQGSDVVIEDDGEEDNSMRFLLNVILDEIPEPSVRVYDNEAADDFVDAASVSGDRFSLAAVSVGADQFLGRTCSGRITSGSISIDDKVTVLPRDLKDGGTVELATSSISGIFAYKGIHRVPFDEIESTAACAGDYVTLTGVPDSMAVGDTVTSTANPIEKPIETPPLAPPTLSMDFGANDGPFSGKEGTSVASSQIRSRLFAETDNNVTLKVEKHPTDTEKTVVFARGELQLGILVEQMRREGFEILISPPRILTKQCEETGKTLEPFEEVIVDVDSEYTGAVVNIITGSDRKGTLIEMGAAGDDGKCQITFEMPSRGMLGGFRSEIATATRGSAVINHVFIGDREVTSSVALEQKGKIISTEAGKASAYALASIEARGTLFIEPGEDVYSGMVIGENAKNGDLEVNPIRAKDKTNIRTQAKDEKVQLAPPKRLNVEELIAYMAPDEVIEVTPKSIRLRKLLLDSGARQRASRSKAKQLKALKAKR